MDVFTPPHTTAHLYSHARLSRKRCWVIELLHGHRHYRVSGDVEHAVRTLGMGSCGVVVVRWVYGWEG